MSRFILNDDGNLNILVNEDIYHGWSAYEFNAWLDHYSEKVKSSTVFINSDGGSVTEGMAIRAAMLRLGKTVSVDVEVDGVAASIASILALSGTSKPKMRTGTYLMIHNPFLRTAGDDEELLSASETVKTMKNDLATIYAEKSSLSKDEALEYMKKETWISASKAAELGFAEHLTGEPVVYNYNPSAKDHFLNKYDNVPQSILNNPINKAQSEPNKEGEGTMPGLNEILAGDPEAKKEHEAAIAKAKADGKAEALKAAENSTSGENGEGDDGAPAEPVENKGRAIALAKSVAGSDKYPAAIRAQAIECASGDLDPIVFQASVSAHDATVAAMGSATAHSVTASNGETTGSNSGSNDDGSEDDGVITSLSQLTPSNGGN